MSHTREPRPAPAAPGGSHPHLTKDGSTSADRHVIEVSDLTKRYADLVAVDSVSFSVERGEVFGILGPNGAGKTTTLEMIEGLRQPDGGGISVDGLRVWPTPKEVKRRIGVQLQATALFDYQRVREIVYLFGSCYGLYRTRAECVALLERVGLAEKADVFVNQLSGGQAQRLSIALALVNDPVVTFLDEPTTGLDPRARRALWEVIEEINRAGTTMVLTSHYMEEAERLCDRVAVMDQGHIVALDTPRALINGLGAEATVTFSVDRAVPAALFCSLAGVSACRDLEPGYEVMATDTQQAVVSLLDVARRERLRVENLDVQGANLEDVFLALTGRKLGGDDGEAEGTENGARKRRGLFRRRR